MSYTVRGERLQWKCGVAEGRDRQPGECAWCGQPIVLLDPTDYRRAKRTRHRGDEHEAEGSPRCQREFDRSVVWNARALIILRGDPCCVDCGDMQAYWHADHRIPLCDGGPHDPTNIERRCEGCHKRKTAAEAAARAEGRRLSRLPAPSPHRQLALVGAA